MDLAFSRAAFSPVIAEADDRSDGIYAAADGRADRAGRARPAGLRRHDAVLDRRADRLIGEGAARPPRAGRHLHRQRPLSRRHAPDGRALRHAVLPRRQICSAGFRTPAIGPTSAAWCRAASRPHATEVEQEGLRLPPVKLFKRGVLDREILSIILLQHPRRRPAHRRHQGAGGGADGRRAASLRAPRPLRRRDGRSGDRRDQRRAPRSRCAPRSRRSPTGSIAPRPSSIPTGW